MFCSSGVSRLLVDSCVCPLVLLIFSFMASVVLQFVLVILFLSWGISVDEVVISCFVLFIFGSLFWVAPRWYVLLLAFSPLMILRRGGQKA